MRNLADGGLAPCCRWDARGKSLGRLEGLRADGFLNQPTLKKARRDMLAGKRLAQCERCQAHESFGWYSMRNWANDRFSGFFDAVAQTRKDGGLRDPRLRYLHLTFSNLCNYSCRTCNPELSSGWYPDLAAMAGERLGKVPRPRLIEPGARGARFLEVLKPHLDEAHTIQFGGAGEPLLAREHYDVLDYLASRRRFDVALFYTTNFSTLRLGSRDALRYWTKFREVRVVASLDAMGARAQYLRKGQKWDGIVDNRKRLMRECPRVDFAVASTLSVFNALHLPNFHRDWVEKGYLAADGMRIKALRWPRYYRAHVLGPELLERAIDAYRAYVDRLEPLGEAAAAPFRSALAFLNSRDDCRGELEALRSMTARLDRLRGEQLLEAFPELSPLFSGRDDAAATPPKRRR